MATLKLFLTLPTKNSLSMKSTKNSNDEVSAFANAGGEIGQYDNFNCDAQPESNFEEEADIVKTKPMKLAGKVQ